MAMDEYDARQQEYDEEDNAAGTVQEWLSENFGPGHAVARMPREIGPLNALMSVTTMKGRPDRLPPEVLTAWAALIRAEQRHLDIAARALAREQKRDVQVYRVEIDVWQESKVQTLYAEVDRETHEQVTAAQERGDDSYVAVYARVAPVGVPLAQRVLRGSRIMRVEPIGAMS